MHLDGYRYSYTVVVCVCVYIYIHVYIYVYTGYVCSPDSERKTNPADRL